MEDNYFRLEYRNKEEFAVYVPHEVCDNCGKPIMTFIKEQGWHKRERNTGSEEEVEKTLREVFGTMITREEMNTPHRIKGTHAKQKKART